MRPSSAGRWRRESLAGLTVGNSDPLHRVVTIFASPRQIGSADVKYRKIGGTNLEVSMIGFGSWAIGGSNWGPTNQDESIRAIEQALDSGITFFDTAYSYGGGHSEELLAMALASHRQHVVLATKGGIVPGRSKKDFSAAHLRAALEGSLRRLATEYIDLYYLHNPTPEDMTRGECFEALEQFK